MVCSHAEVSTVEKSVDVRTQEEAVVQTVLSSLGDRSDVRGLQHGSDSGSRDGTTPMVSVEDHRLEGSLPQPLPGQTSVSVHGSGAMPRLGGIDVTVMTEQQCDQFTEVAGLRVRGKVETPAPNEVPSEVLGRIGAIARWEEAHIAQQYASDDRVLAPGDGFVPIVTDPLPQPRAVYRAVSFAVDPPGLRQGQPFEPAAKPSTMILFSGYRDLKKNGSPTSSTRNAARLDGRQKLTSF